jgi:hypothetical protein
MLEDDPIRDIVLDGMFRNKLTVEEFINKLRYAMKDDVNRAYEEGYGAGYLKAKNDFGHPPHYNPNL